MRPAEFELSDLFAFPRLAIRLLEGVADWQRIHRIRDKVHRARIAAVAIAAILLIDVLVR